MATWITHLRIYDATRELFGFDGGLYDSYLVGSLAPDSGSLCPDGISYYPPRKLLHRTSDDGKTIYYDDFRAEYVDGCEDADSRAFYLGYYVHLIADDVWTREIYLPMRARYSEQIDADRRFVWRYKKQWYDLDREYLSKHACPAFERLKALPAVQKQYLPYIEPEKLTAKLAEIAAFYADLSYTSDDEYVFLTQGDVDKVVRSVAERVARANSEFGIRNSE